MNLLTTWIRIAKPTRIINKYCIIIPEIFIENIHYQTSTRDIWSRSMPGVRGDVKYRQEVHGQSKMFQRVQDRDLGDKGQILSKAPENCISTPHILRK